MPKTAGEYLNYRYKFYKSMRETPDESKIDFPIYSVIEPASRGGVVQ